MIVLLLLSAGLGLLRFNDIPVGSFWDDAHYIVLAESLAHGTGYRLTNLPGAPVEEAFPPGYPLLLVPLVALFPENFVPLQALSLLFWLGSLGLLWRLWRQQFAPEQALALLALVAISPHLVGMASTVMSESPYLFFSLLVLNLVAEVEGGAQQVAFRQRPLRQQLLLLGGLLLSLVATTLIRTVGITLVMGLAAYWLVRYGRRYLKTLALLLLAGGLLLLPIAWFNLQNGGALIFSPLYFEHVQTVSQQFGRFLQSWRQGIDIAFPIIASAIIPLLDLQGLAGVLGTGMVQGLVWLTLLMTAVGFLLSLRRMTAVHWYVLFYVALMYFWVVYTLELRVRMVLPVLPFLFIYFMQPIWLLIQKVWPQNRQRQQQTIAAVLAVMALIFLARHWHEWQSPIAARTIDLNAGVAWIQDNVPADAVIMTPNATPEYLYYRRPTVYAPGHDQVVPDLDIAAVIDETNVSYIMIRPHLNDWGNTTQALDTFTADQLLPFLQAHPQRFTAVYTNPDANMTIYRVVR